MRVEDSGILVCVYLINLALYGFNKSDIFNGRIDRNISLGLRNVTNIDSKDGLSPFFKFRHLLARKLISTASNTDYAIVS
jgi:hypothetical protein